MPGSLPEADDAVQETWVRFAVAGTEGVGNVSGWLTTIVTRACLNVVRARAAPPEQPAGMHVPDPIAVHADDAAPHPEQEALPAESVGLALMGVLDALTPPERVAFVLHDVFGAPFSVLGRSEQAARQLGRSRRQVKEAGRAPPTWACRSSARSWTRSSRGITRGRLGPAHGTAPPLCCHPRGRRPGPVPRS